MTSIRTFSTILLQDFLRFILLCYLIFSPQLVYSITVINDLLPIASAGEDGTIQLPNNEVVLLGTGNDPDGGFVTFSWFQISGPTLIIENSISGSDLLLSDLIEGIYVFELLVTDDEGNTVKDQVNITVLPETVSGNQLPTVLITNPLDRATITQGETITIEAQASDIDGVLEKVIFYEGDVVIGEAIQEPYIIDWQAIMVGSVTIRAIAIDNEGGESIESSVNINVRRVGDELPLASTSGNIWIKYPASSTTLTGTGYDPDGGAVIVKWTQLYGSTEAILESSTSAKTIVSNLQSGEYKFQFSVTDNEGNEVTDYITITVSEENPLITISGERRKWHKITLEVSGPFSSETDEINPFSDYRFDVLFTKGDKSYLIPGYFAADGNAAETSATNGDKWFVHFSPDEIGVWEYKVIFKSGSQAAIVENLESIDPVTGLDGIMGTFEVIASDKIGRDNRVKGRLNYVGKRYLQYEESGEYFLKGGADSPENFLAYEDFDNTPNNQGLIKQWEAHEKDWKLGDPSWKNGKGKGIIGALNFLARKEMNAFSFLTMNINGDDKNVYPYLEYNGKPSPQHDRLRFDCSKLAQWERVFEHADELGLFMHFKIQEIENNNLLDGGNLGIERKLYLRELIARFGHHLALNWNLGEENTQTDQQIVDMANYIRKIDAYNHHLVIHSLRTTQNYNNRYTGLLGEQSEITGASMQITYDEVHRITKIWLENSNLSGKKWVISNDEQAPGVPPDNHIPSQENALNYPQSDIRKYVLWGNLMAGGSGVEYYFGYQWRECSDLTCQDFNYYNKLWEETHYALSFLRENTPYYDMENYNELVGNINDDNSKYCLAKPNEKYVVYYPNASNTGNINLSNVEEPILQSWFNPRTGAFEGESFWVTPEENTTVGMPPSSENEDWVTVFEVKKNADILSISWGNSIEDSSIFQNNTLPLSLEVNDLLGNIAYIEYEINGKLLGIANVAPYRFEWTPITNDTYILIAKAYNDEGVKIAVTEALKIEVISSLAPIVNAGADTIIILPNDSIQLIGSGSDPDGGEVAFTWSLLSGPDGITIENVYSNNLTLSGLIEGEYLFSLQVIDDEGSVSTDEVKLDVLGETDTTLPDSISISWVNSLNDTTIFQNSTFNLSLEVSDLQSEIAYVEYETNEEFLGVSQLDPYNYKWIPLTNDTYTLIAKAYDTDGTEIAISDELIIQVVPNLMPNVYAGEDTTIVLPIDSIQLIGSGSDPDGGEVTFTWSLLSGPEGITIENAYSDTLVLRNLIAGEYLFNLKIIDDEGLETSDEVNLYVLNESDNVLPKVTILSPTDSLVIQRGEQVPLSVEAFDSDGSIRSVQFYANDKLLYTINKPPYLHVWESDFPGFFRIKAKALDNQNALVTSKSILIEVIDEPLSQKGVLSKNQTIKVKAYPNPVRDNLLLDIDYPYKTLFKSKVYGLDGKIIQEFDMVYRPKQVTSIDLTSINTGIYILHVNLGNSIKIFKFIKK